MDANHRILSKKIMMTTEETIEGKYHTSWDWFMPVWRKWLTDSAFLTAHNPQLRIQRNEIKEDLSDSIISVDIKMSHLRLTHAIEWYNQNK